MPGVWLRAAAIAGVAIWVSAGGDAAGEDGRPARPSLEDAQPLATSRLQTVTEQPAAALRPAVAGMYMVQPAASDPLANYERAPLGDWRIPAEVDVGDPWVRLLLLARSRPVVVDLAVFIDGKPFRAAREAWIDELLAAGDDTASSAAAAAMQQISMPNGESAGTPGASDSSLEDGSVSDGSPAGAEPAAAGDEAPPEAAVTIVPPQARQTPAMRQRLRQYLAAQEMAVAREEIRWLIAEWGSGPELLVAGPSLGWQRADVAPLLAYLDEDNDGGLSAAELAQVGDRLRQADIDQNDVVDMAEIRRLTGRSGAVTGQAIGHALLVLLDEATDWPALAATMNQVYADDASAGAMTAAQVDALRAQEADLTIRVDFNKSASELTGVSVVSIRGAFAGASPSITATDDVITIDIGSDYIELTAAVGGESGAAYGGTAQGDTELARSQIAIGAALDGHPLTRVVDRDQDGRLTIRERQQLVEYLAGLDRDGDGAISPAEIPTPIRLAVTLGPQVHQLLATPTAAARELAPRPEQTAPAWFVSMDKNGDGDLSRAEFLGSSEQFQRFDADGDGLLSAAEAAALEGGSN